MICKCFQFTLIRLICYENSSELNVLQIGILESSENPDLSLLNPAYLIKAISQFISNFNSNGHSNIQLQHIK